MVPPELTNFFIASTSASAALLGLLFVAMSIAPEHTVTRRAPQERQAVATSTFTALVTAFFISLSALIPIGLGYTTLFMCSIALLNSLILGWHLLRHSKSRQNFLRRALLIAASLVIYGYIFYYALLLSITPLAKGYVYLIASLLLAVYGIALVRAWELLGARRYGILAWFSPLQEVDEPTPIPVDRQLNSSSQTSNGEKFPEREKSYSDPNEQNVT